MKKSIVISLLTVAIIFCTAIYSFASTGKVTTDTLRLRKDASTEASIMALLSMDQEVEILEEKNGWYKVKAEVESGEIEGYVSADYVEVIKNNTLEKNETDQEENTVNEEETNTEENNEENTDTQKVMVKTIPAGTKLYITPVVNALVLNTLEEEKQIEIISEVNGWNYISAGDIKGWIRTENIVEKEASETEQNTSSQKTGYISGSSVNFREDASTSSTVKAKLLRNTQVTVISEEGSWTKIRYNDEVGYVASNYISDNKVTVTTRGNTSRTSSSSKTTEAETTTTTEKTTTVAADSAKASQVVAYAKQYLGYKYVYGGSTPSGFDCSGFTSYVYKHFGISLSRTSSGQASNGRAVSKSDLQAGDIVCFARSSGSKKIGHVGIYIGGGKFIHAANAKKGVIISNVSGSGVYYVCARRVL